RVGLRRPAVPTAVVRDRAEPGVGEHLELDLPRVRAERPAVAEHDRLPLALVGVVDLGPVGRGDVRHDVLLVRRTAGPAARLVRPLWARAPGTGDPSDDSTRPERVRGRTVESFVAP